MRIKPFPVGAMWLCVLAKLIFYSSFVPLWEGYDEFSHFAFVEYLVNYRTLPDLRNANVAGEIAESLRTVPTPWTIRNWNTDWITHDDYWRGRRPAALPVDQRLYEAQQPPLAYVIYAIPYALFRHTSLAARVWIVRIAGSLIVSLVVPLGFLLARRVLIDTASAIGAVAIASSMPELMQTAAHGGNEPLAIVVATGCVYALCARRTLLLGCLLGLGLLTKAYFLTLIPAIAVVYAMRYRRRILRPLMITLGSAIAISGWWYARAFYATGTLTGTQFSGVAATTLKPINWLGVADFALISHLWIGGWSFLVLRTWMYRAVELTLLAACAGLGVRAVRRRLDAGLGACIVTVFFFWTGMAYFAYMTWLATGEAAVLGYYACALVVPEAICIIAGMGTRYIAPFLVALFAAMELYGTAFLLMPYYAGLTAHNARGSVPAGHLGQLLSAEIFRNLARNKPEFLTAGALVVLFIVLVFALAGIVAVATSAAFGERGELRTGSANSFVPLRSG